MRLTCPNCAAQYEVPPEAIPPTGRDVQCSACAHTWFEQPPEERPRLLDPDPLEDTPRVEGDDEEADDLAELSTTPMIGADPAPPPADPMPEPAAADPLPPRPRVAPEVERILREEAEREAQVRAEEAARRALPDSVPEIATAPAPRRLRTLDDDDDDDGPLVRVVPPAAPPPARPATRPARQVDRELDLDRINSTLRSHGDKLGARAPQVDKAPRRRRGAGGFLGGFTGTLLILAVLASLYVWRTEIVEAVPQTAAVLDPYGNAVDQMRFWLDRELARILGATGAG